MTANVVVWGKEVVMTSGISSQGQHIIKSFIDDLSENKDLSNKTLSEYSSDIKHFIKWFESGIQNSDYFGLEEVATPTITRYREVSENELSLQPATINRRLVTLKCLFSWAVEKRLIHRDPTKPVKLLRQVKTSPRKMTDKEEAALVAAVERDGSVRDHTIIVVMLQTGLRTMELCDLAPENVTIGKRSGTLVVRGKGNKYREVPLNSTCREALSKYLESYSLSNSSYLFRSVKTGGRLSERGLRHLVRKYMLAARLEGLSAHDLRHRFGYVLAEKTPIHRIAQIMGHDSLDTTMIYVSANKEDLQNEVEKIAWK